MKTSRRDFSSFVMKRITREANVCYNGELSNTLLREPMDKKVWQRVKDQNLDYYTPYPTPKSTYIFSGDGSTIPSPKEVCEFLNAAHSQKGARDRVVHEGRGVFRSTSKQHTEEEVIDLPDGIYRFQPETFSTIGELPDRLVPISVREDKYVPIEYPFNLISKDLTKFLENKQFYKDRGFIYKLGILMYGSPGMGKTAYLRKIVDSLLPKDSIVIFLPELPQSSFLDKMKESISNRLKVFIFEELASNTSEKYDIDQLLDFLDGEASMANSITFATTNYPEKIPENVIDRTSRFDKIYEISHPTGDELSALLSTFLNKTPTEGELKAAKGLSIADLKEICFLVSLHERTFEEAAKSLKDRHAVCKKAFAKASANGIGFGG